MNTYFNLILILTVIPWVVNADCPDLSTLIPPTHGTYVLNTEKTNTTATVICKMGYFTDSMDVIAVTCTNSTWNITTNVICQPNMNTCNPFTLPNGLSSDDITRRLKDDTDDVATFTCEMGTLVGPSTTTCLPNGTWSYMGENSSCQGRLCGELPSTLIQPEHGFYEILNDTNGRNIETGVVLRCEPSYKPLTSQFYAATCNSESGIWSEVNLGTCQLITCPYPFPYHLLSIWENENPEMHVNINDVHTLVCYNTSATETSHVLVGSESVRCSADGKWNNIVDLSPEEMLPANATQCADIPCPLLTITNGYFKIENKMSTEDDTIVRTFCDMGYTLRSSMAAVARCSATTNQWLTDETPLGSSSTSFLAPSCIPISEVGCSDIDLYTLFPNVTYHYNDMNKIGNISIPGMIVTFQCTDGYTIIGSNSTICTINEMWEPLQPNTRCVDTRTTIPPMTNTTNTTMPNSTATTMPTFEPTFEPTSDPDTDIPTDVPAGDDVTNNAATSSSSSFVGSAGFIALVVVVPVAAIAIITILILMHYCRTHKTEKQDIKDRIKQDTLVGPTDVCINMTTTPTTPTKQQQGAEVQPQPQPQPEALPGAIV